MVTYITDVNNDCPAHIPDFDKILQMIRQSNELTEVYTVANVGQSDFLLVGFTDIEVLKLVSKKIHQLDIKSW